MAATILVKQALWRVSQQLLDTDPQFEHWEQIELVDHLNDTASLICALVPLANSRVDAIKLRQGTRQSIATIAAADCKPGDGSTPTTPIYGLQVIAPRRNMGGNGMTPGNAIRVVERDMMDALVPDWHTKTGSRVRSVVYDPQDPHTFYVSPGVPGTPNVWIELAYSAQPSKVPNVGTEDYSLAGTNTTVIPVDDEYIDALVNGILARANMKDTTYASRPKVAEHNELFLATLRGKIQAITGTDPNLTTLPGVSQPAART